MSDLWIPITGMICIAAVVLTNLVLSARHKGQVHQTLQQHLSNGGQLSVELLQQMGATPSGWKTDLRKGLILIALGLACLAAGAVVNNASLGMVFGVFPLFTGLAFCIAARIN
ncbi:DUF6249 domain-containing protein [Bowmanella pacifica]|uniref:DUF6249 domain-containing protein n=1 Tax=Bowmanella pacifica TaxID=502051 RepID=A0A918DHQ4_9ALTE|nr:DUF6249 domain-containing protein [Bowmanella pacifica]GGO65832.1 hypothetical protein GCM10010982_08580 [Bowmanella pacifica]